MFQYTVQPGDTLYSIAAKFSVPAEAILAANPGLYPYNLVIGQIISIPGSSYPYPVYPVYPQSPIIVPFPIPRFPGRGVFPPRRGGFPGRGGIHGGGGFPGMGGGPGRGGMHR